MKGLPQVLCRLRRSRGTDVVSDELRLHIDLETEDLVRQGVPRAEARRQALIAFGGVERVRAEAHDVTQGRVKSLVDHVWHDARYSARGLVRSRGFSAVAILTLALGIGATSAIFSVVYGVLLKPLPFDHPERLASLYHVTPASQTDAQQAAAYFTYRDHGRMFEDIGLWQTANVYVTRNASPEQVQAVRVTDGTLSLLGVHIQLGRLIQKEDDTPGAPLRVILTHAYWQQTFGSSTDVIGQSLVIDGRPYEIIGVLPATFKFLNNDPQVFLPLRLNRANTLTGVFAFNGIARLKPNVTLAQANDDIARMIPLITKQFPLEPGITQQMWDSVGLRPNVRPLSEAVIGQMSRPLWLLLGTVGIVLLLAWTNVANLLLVRAERRQRELAVREALGASRYRVAAELLLETLMLGLVGGGCGVLFAQGGISLLRTIAPAALPRVDDIRVDALVLLVTLAISIVTSLLFGLVPVLKSRRFDAGLLKEGGRSTTDPPGRHRARSTLVVVQVALALVLLVVSGLMGRTFIAMQRVQPGYVRPANVETFDIPLPASIVRDRQQVTQTYHDLFERLSQVPGVDTVGLGPIILNGIPGTAPIYVKDRRVEGLPPIGSFLAIGAGYAETLGDSVVAGRTISWDDVVQAKPVVVVSENLAREYWRTPGNAVSQRVSFYPDGPWLEVIGVIGDVRANGLNQPAPWLLYRPLSDGQFVSRNVTFLVRSNRVGTPGFLRELQHAVWSVNPHVPFTKIRTLDEIQAASMSQTSFAMVMLDIAAGVALLLALVGIYGVVSYIAAARTHEIGIRMALGAQGRDVRGLFLRHGLALALAGIALGVGAAALVTPAMSSLLYGVAPTDPVTYALVAITLGAVTLVATYLPTRRASRVDPLIALRGR